MESNPTQELGRQYPQVLELSGAMCTTLNGANSRRNN